MALMPPAFLNSVVAIGVATGNGQVTFNATGFLYGHPSGEVDDQGNKTYRVALVTNRHVLEGAIAKKQSLQARFNTLTGSGANTYPIDTQERWAVHPDPKVDVAVVPIDTRKLEADGIEYAILLGDKHALSHEEARAGQISEGDGVFILGFPLRLAGKERNYAITRQGIVARVQPWLKGYDRTFLIDASIFPGNSGGPVFLKPELASIEGTKSNSHCSLIGMVSYYLAYREEAISKQTGLTRVIFEENSGLAAVVPHERIQEAIQAAVAERIVE